MKTSKLVLVSAVLTLVLVANRFAGTTQASKNESSVYKQLEEQMPFPEFAREGNLNGKVLVEFTFNEDGQIEIRNLNYSNVELKKYVADRLHQMKISVPRDASGKIYQVAFSFNLVP